MVLMVWLPLPPFVPFPFPSFVWSVMLLLVHIVLALTRLLISLFPVFSPLHIFHFSSSVILPSLLNLWTMYRQTHSLNYFLALSVSEEFSFASFLPSIWNEGDFLMGYQFCFQTSISIFLSSQLQNVTKEGFFILVATTCLVIIFCFKRSCKLLSMCLNLFWGRKAIDL